MVKMQHNNLTIQNLSSEMINIMARICRKKFIDCVTEFKRRKDDSRSVEKSAKTTEMLQLVPFIIAEWITTHTQHSADNAFSVCLSVQIAHVTWYYIKLKTGSILWKILHSISN